MVSKINNPATDDFFIILSERNPVDDLRERFKVIKKQAISETEFKLIFKKG